MDDREFAAALCDRDAILILSHLRPDGDTLGSGAALCSALRRMGKTAYLFPNPETTARYLPYVAQFFAPADFVPACVVAVDIATPDLFPQGFSGAVDLCIDHHPSNALYAGATLLHAEKSACGEAVLDLIELMAGSVTEQEANLLYIAVTTDTGCFQYANTNAATLRAAARLLELGADNRKISMDFFRKISRARMALVGQIYSGMRFFRGGQVAITVVTRALIDSVHATEDDCDDIAGLPGRAEGVVVSVTIRELTRRPQQDLRAHERLRWIPAPSARSTAAAATRWPPAARWRATRRRPWKKSLRPSTRCGPHERDPAGR